MDRKQNTTKRRFYILPGRRRRSIGKWPSLNLSLTNELRAFIDQNSGDGTLYATPSEFVRDVLRRHKAQQEAAVVRDGVLAGYQDAIAGRTVAFESDLMGLIRKKPQAWKKR